MIWNGKERSASCQSNENFLGNSNIHRSIGEQIRYATSSGIEVSGCF